MTEDEWLTVMDPQAMLDFLRYTDKLSDRKARLFAVACCSQIAYLLRDKQSWWAVRTSELYADGLCTEKRMRDGRAAAHQAMVEWVPPESKTVGRRFAEEVAYAVTLKPAERSASEAADLAARVSEAEAREPGYMARRTSQCDLLRDLFIPFHSVALGPALLTPQVVVLSQDIYDARSFDRLLELAAALEAAGCDDANLLGHLRGPGPHCRGCWAIDLILGKV